MVFILDFWGNVLKIIYGIFVRLDVFVYGVAGACFDLIRDIYNVSFFGESNLIATITRRIYLVLAIIMVFRVILAGVQYIINPDTFDDKEKGLVGILKNALITVILIALVPAVFDFAISIQDDIVKEIPNVIFGTGNTKVRYENDLGPDDISKEVVVSQNEEFKGENIAFAVLQGFISPAYNESNKKVSDKASVGLVTEDNKNNPPVIHDLKSFGEHATEGMEDGFDKSHYDYMIIVSTLGGGFLVYILGSMTFDIAIRTIKLGIIQMLSPIPISSYMFKKDNFNKFVKTSIKVYLDLFVRMLIIYIIILVIQILINSGVLNIFRDTNKDDWLINFLRNIVLIFGLLMFAKSAPKFISELLGLPDVTSGEMADMFKPAWQRAGGAAGALVNPVRTSVSSVREAWKNNADMVDSRGGKIRRALQKTRRVGNAARYGVTGLARGTADSFAGVAAGDNWSKLNDRYRKSVKKSSTHSAEGFMKRTDNDKRQEVLDKRKQIEKTFAENGIDINQEIKNAHKTARSKIAQERDNLDGRIADLRHNIAMGYGSEAANKQELEAALARKALLSTKDGFNSAVEEEAGKIRDNLVNDALDNRIDNIQNKINENNVRATNIKNRLATDSTLTDKARRELEVTFNSIKKENDELNQQISIEGRAKMYEEYQKAYDSFVNDEIPEREISTGTIMRGHVDEFFGGAGFTGKGYVDTADLLKTNRSNLYTGEAMTKMRQNANILVKADGTQATFTSKFTNSNANANGYSYSEMADLKKLIDTGKLSGADLVARGFDNAAMFQSAFEEVEKKAAEAYVTANMAAIDPTIHTEIRLKSGEKENSTIVLGIQRLKASIAAANIPKAKKDEYLRMLSQNPGDFFKRASDIQEELRTIGSRINAYNSGTKDS